MSGKEIDKLFAEKLKNHRVKPSSNAWKQLDKQLGKDGRKPAAWWKWAPLLLILLIGAGTAYHFWTVQEPVTPQKTTLSTELIENKTETIDTKNTETTITTEKTETPLITEKEVTTTTNKQTKNNTKTAKTSKAHKKVKQQITNKAKISASVGDIKEDKSDVAISNLKIDDDNSLPMPDTQIHEEITTDTEGEKDLKTTEKVKDGELVDAVDKDDLPKLDSKNTKEDMEEAEANNKVKKQKKKRFKVEINIPSRNKRLRKMGQQQTQGGVAINFKKVLHNVFDN